MRSRGFLQTKRTYTLIVIAVAVVVAAYWYVSNRKLTYYSCREGMAFMCTTDKDVCKMKDFKTEFLVDRTTGSVSQITYFKYGVADSVTHKSCTVFDDKNWDCSDQMRNDYGVLITFEHKMVKGVYTYGIRRSDDHSDNRPIAEKAYMDGCAK